MSNKIQIPADWGTKDRKVQIEISESDHTSFTIEIFIVKENGKRISFTVATEKEVADVMPLAQVAEKLLEIIPVSADAERI